MKFRASAKLESSSELRRQTPRKAMLLEMSCEGLLPLEVSDGGGWLRTKPEMTLQSSNKEDTHSWHWASC